MPSNKKEPDNTLSHLKTGNFSRGISLLKASIKAGSVAAQQMWGKEKSPEELTKFLVSQIQTFTHEIGQLKGSAMKVGQLLSTYGEHFLPPEANQILKSLQQRSPPLAWKEIKKQLVKELGPKIQELEIDHKPLASASIGQVHRAVVKSTGQVLALKIQYPGVDSAIDMDLKLFKFLLTTLQFLPKGVKFDQIFEEVREMLYQEVDYTRELEFTEHMHRALKDDPHFVVAKPVREYSTQRVIATEMLEGFAVDSPEVLGLPLERRNRLGEIYLQLYLDELFKFKMVQTDPHLGNYKVKLNDNGQDQLMLFDFGATRKVPDLFLANYKLLIEGGVERDAAKIEAGGRNLGLVRDEDSEKLIQTYIDLCFLITEPFQEGIYDWGLSDLPKRVAKKGSELAFNFSLRSPPRETVFLDRKLGGVFIFLKVLGCKMETRSLLKSYLS